MRSVNVKCLTPLVGKRLVILLMMQKEQLLVTVVFNFLRIGNVTEMLRWY